MKVSVGNRELLEALGKVTAVRARASFGPPSIAMVKLSVEEGMIHLNSTDLERWLTVSLEAKTKGKGHLLLDPQSLATTATVAPGNVVVIEAKPASGAVVVTCGSVHVEMPWMDPLDFPPAPDTGLEDGVEVDSEALAEAIGKVFPFTAKGEKHRPIMECVHIRRSGDHTIVEAVTGHKMAMIRMGPWLEEGKELLIRPESALAVRSLLSEGPVTVQSGGYGWLGFKTSTWKFCARRQDGEFPDVGGLLSKLGEPDTTVVVAKEDLTRAATLARGTESGHCAMKIGKDHILVEAGGDRGSYEETIPAEVKGLGIRLGMNPEYLLSVCKGVETDNIKVTFTTPMRPVLFYRTDEVGDMYLIMPVNLPHLGEGSDEQD